jgi:hypothetical protein
MTATGFVYKFADETNHSNAFFKTPGMELFLAFDEMWVYIFCCPL